MEHISMNTVSVIIPTYKNRGGLNKSIDSVLSQDCPNLLEIIVVDDNDPNSEFRKATASIMKLYEGNKFVKYICHEANKNGAAARNTGIRASHGDYIAFLDDDDLFLANKLNKQVAYLDKTSNVDAVYCFAQRKGRTVSTKSIEGDGTRDILLLQSNLFTPSLMFRRKALENINGFDETFRRHQDYDLLLRFFSAGYSIGCVQEVLIEIGLNEGENIPKGEKLNQLKSFFFEKFTGFIDQEEAKTPGFKKKVYAKHYAGVFLSHIKNGFYSMAFRTFCIYFKYSPMTFCGVVWRSFVIHLKGNA